MSEFNPTASVVDTDTYPEPQAEHEPEAPTAPPKPVFERLRKGFEQKQSADRRKTFLITPGDYGGALGVRFKRIDWEDQTKRAKRVRAQSMDSEAEANYGASLLVEACDTILLLDTDGRMKPAAEVDEAYVGEGPIRFDHRLATYLGLDAEGLDEVAICRLAYGNPQALTFAFQALQSWLAGEIADDEDDEEDDADRPT